jgi:DNA-directed RNA polymerase I, II, and III subunit RPABC2
MSEEEDIFYSTDSDEEVDENAVDDADVEEAEVDPDVEVEVDADDSDVEEEAAEESDADVEMDMEESNIDAEGEDEDDEDDDDIKDSYLQKFNEEIRRNYVVDFHPECVINNYEEVRALSNVIRDKNGNVVDDLHKTIPYLTKYERTRVIGQRAKQINSGAKPFVKVPETVIDGCLIAEMELIQKKIPFVIRRPTPSGGCEYWNLKDLDIISF